jgi:large subunit ribosomal protein L19
MNKLQKIHSQNMKTDLTEVNVGDTVKVHTRVIEGGKDRIQIFAGIIIGKQGIGVSQNITVRKISNGEGVERVFPVHSPRVASLEIVKRGKVRRAKLNYLRGRVGKEATTVKEAARVIAAK